MNSKLIGVWHQEPNKYNNWKRARLYRLYCQCEDSCPFLEKGQCIHINSRCVYGHREYMATHTTRAKAYFDELARFDEIAGRGPKPPKRAPKILAFVGGYVWLPFRLISMHESISVLGRFMLAADFTPEMIVYIVKHCPHLAMADDYREEVSEFLYQLRQIRPQLFQAAARIEPGIVDKLPGVETWSDKPVKVTSLPPMTIQLPYRVRDGQELRALAAWDEEYVTATLPADFWEHLLGLTHKDNIQIRFNPTPETKARVANEDLLQELADNGEFLPE